MTSHEKIFADDSLTPFVWCVGLMLFSTALGWNAFELPGISGPPLNLDQKFYLGGGGIACFGLSIFMFALTLNKPLRINLPRIGIIIAIVGILILGHGLLNLAQARLG